MYVGKGSGARAWAHLRRKDASRFARSLRKLESAGKTPTIEVIPAINEDHAFFLESCLIEVIGRQDLGSGPLLNHNDGGRGSPRPSEEVRARMSASHTGVKKGPHSEEARAKISLSQRTSPKVLEQRARHAALMTGRTASDETRAKMSATRLARGGFSEAHLAAIKKAAQERGLRQRAARAAKEVK